MPVSGAPQDITATLLVSRQQQERRISFFLFWKQSWLELESIHPTKSKSNRLLTGQHRIQYRHNTVRIDKRTSLDSESAFAPLVADSFILRWTCTIGWVQRGPADIPRCTTPCVINSAHKLQRSTEAVTQIHGQLCPYSFQSSICSRTLTPTHWAGRYIDCITC